MLWVMGREESFLGDGERGGEKDTVFTKKGKEKLSLATIVVEKGKKRVVWRMGGEEARGKKGEEQTTLT